MRFARKLLGFQLSALSSRLSDSDVSRLQQLRFQQRRQRQRQRRQLDYRLELSASDTYSIYHALRGLVESICCRLNWQMKEFWSDEEIDLFLYVI